MSVAARHGQESGPVDTAEPISAQTVTKEKEGGEKLDSVTNREPLRLHLKDGFTKTLRPLEHQMLQTLCKIFPCSCSLQRSTNASFFTLLNFFRHAHFYNSTYGSIA
ncbi:hypothetical protein PoB_001808600 [Plakobranchus ocellatus]|uniref:Uncharacterized protein n=1 Tax=Plakobranchus ocellatus TaxID=259542 RepID=A0AAV3YWU9_9GAST|nr:hypothetical protein PoB_001808600 [Plakobranchus ocellatus]